MKKIIIFFLFALFILRSFPCGNYYFALDKEGHAIPLGYEWKFPFSKNFNPELNVQKLKQLEKKLKKDKNFMLLSDYSLCLMKLGKAKEASEILKELYLHYPNEYKIAANLGTAYELIGENDSALKYIRRGMQLNPDDHEGSEWIHAKILETKIALKKDPAFLSNHSVMQLTEKQKKDSTVFYHLSIQLKERFPFTPGPDPIMASLMADLGDLSFNVKSIEYAKAYYLIAKNYYGNTSPDLDAKVKEINKLIGKYKEVKTPANPHLEGGAHRIHAIDYKTLISNNNEANDKIDWAKINTNVDSLLALVDFKKTVSEVRTDTKPSDDLKIIPDKHDTDTPDVVKIKEVKQDAGKEQKKEEKSNRVWMYLLGSLVIIFGAYFLKRKAGS